MSAMLHQQYVFIGVLIGAFFTHACFMLQASPARCERDVGGGCRLKQPQADIQRLFPKSTHFVIDRKTIAEYGSDALIEEIQQKLQPHPKGEVSPDAAYPIYRVFKKDRLIGYVFGMEEQGEHGPIQLILAVSPEGEIVSWYYQKFDSPEAHRFHTEAFKRQFIGLTLTDFYGHHLLKGALGKQDRLNSIRAPSQTSIRDLGTTCRGIKKALILLDIFCLSRQFDADWKRLKALAARQGLIQE